MFNKMKGLYISIFIIWGFLLFSCKQEGFQKSEQNPADFKKLVRISELIHLHELDNSKPFEESLYIEATVNGIDNSSIHVQDGSDMAIRIFADNTSTFNVNDLVRVKVGGEVLILDNAHYAVSPSSEITTIGFGANQFSTVALESLTADIRKFTSRVVSLSDLVFTEKEKKDEVTAYLIAQDIAPDLKIWVNIPLELDYDMPMSVSSARGLVVYESGNIYLNVRTRDDIQEIYVEPTMMEKLLNNSTLVRSVVQSSEDEIAPGIKISEMSYMNSDHLLVSCTVFEVDLNNSKVKLESGNPNDAAPPYNTIQTLANMAGHKNTGYASTNWRVLAAVTGDFYVTNAAPLIYTLNGPLVKNGVILKSDFYGTTDQFFGVLKNREGFVVGGRTEFDAVRNNLEQAVGGRVILKDGQDVSSTAIREPRPAIGYTNNNKVFLFAGNGRDLSVSYGFTPSELAQFLKALGCEGAVYMNGGGATVGIMEDSDSGVYNVFSRTHATNPNHNPSIASSWMIVTERD